MTLATHIVAAGAMTRPFIGQVNGFTIFIISVLSHYLIDTIPHADYKLLSIDWKGEQKRDSKIHLNPTIIIIDLLNIAIDIAIGIAFLLVMTRPEITLINIVIYSLIIIGGILPDALQPFFILWKKFPMTMIQDLHDFWHADLRLQLNKRALLSQGVIFLVSTMIIYFY